MGEYVLLSCSFAHGWIHFLLVILFSAFVMVGMGTGTSGAVRRFPSLTPASWVRSLALAYVVRLLVFPKTRAVCVEGGG